jgi:hypothetical protein
MNNDWLAHVSTLFSLLPLGVFLFVRPQLNPSLRFLLSYLVLSILTEALGFYTSYKQINNTLIFQLYTYCEAILILLFFRSIFDNIILKRLILFFILLTGFCGVVFYFFTLPHEFIFVACAIFIMFLSLRHLYFTYLQALVPFLLQNSLFWLIASFLFYFGTTLFLTLFESYARSLGPELHRTVWSFHNGINIIYNTTLAIGIWKIKKK